MALASTQVWEVRTTGDPANSGGFNSAAAGTDRSQQDAPHVIIDGVTITATVNATTTDLDIVGYTVSAADVGNTIRITGGTMTAGTYQIDSIPAAGRWRLDRSAGAAGQTGTGRMGGAQSDPALVAAVSVGLNQIWIKSGTYLITSATQNVAGGCISTPNGGQKWWGYQTTRGDFAALPILRASGINTATIFALSQNDCKLINIEVDGQSLVAIRGISAIGRSLILNCRARNCTNTGIRSSSTGTFIAGCGVTGCTTAGFAFEDAGGGVQSSIYGCWARGNTVTGFSLVAMQATRCISAGNTGATTDGFHLTAAASVAVDCTAYGNGRDGFRATSVNETRLVNCISEFNTQSGFNFTGSGVNMTMVSCAAALNGTNVLGLANVLVNCSFVTGTSTFFTNAAAGDFSVNSTTTGGGLIRSNGFPVSYIDGLTLNYPDRGAVQTSGNPVTGGGGGSGRLQIGQTWT